MFRLGSCDTNPGSGSSTVEPALGTLVNYLAMRRVNTRGMEQANKCMLMAAVAYNLKKLLKWKQTKVETAVMAIKKAGKSLSFYFFNLLHTLKPQSRIKPYY